MTNVDKVEKFWADAMLGTLWMVDALCLSNSSEAFTRLWTSRLWTYTGPVVILGVVEDMSDGGRLYSYSGENKALRVLTSIGVFFCSYSLARQGHQL